MIRFVFSTLRMNSLAALISLVEHLRNFYFHISSSPHTFFQGVSFYMNWLLGFMRKTAHLFFSLSITPENNSVMLHHQFLCHGRPSLVLEEPTVNDLVPLVANVYIV